MSRYYEGDGEEDFPGQWALWEHAARCALKGKRGRRALAELREALRNLPEKRLISRAMCTVAPDSRAPRPTPLPEVAAESEQLREAYARGDRRDLLEFHELIEEQGEGVCAVGAYLWWRKVKAGADPTDAFAALPTLDDASHDLSETAQLAAAEGDLAYSLASNLAYRNDETLENCTPEERYGRFLAWLDAELAEAPANS